MDHGLHSFWTADSVVTEDFLSSAPKPSKRTRRPRLRSKPTTTKAPQTKLGKCGFLGKGLSPSSFGESGMEVPGGSESAYEPSVDKGTTNAAAPTVALAKEFMVGGNLCGTWTPCTFCVKIFSFNRYFIYFFLFHYVLLLKTKYLK